MTSSPAIEAVLARYELAAPRVGAAVAASTRNENLVVHDAGRRYVLRRYRRNTSVERVALQLRFQRHLLARGFPTPGIVATRDGEDVVESDGAPWALFEFVEGEYYDFDRPAHQAEAGRRLARFHLDGASFSEREPVHELTVHAEDYWTGAKRVSAELATLLAGDGVDRELRQLEQWLDELRRALSLDALRALPRGWMHGDYHGRNLLFRGDALHALFDFDNTTKDAWALDIGHGLIAFAREFRGSNRVRPDVAATFIEGYEELRPLDAVERAAIVLLLGADRIPLAAYARLVERFGGHRTDDLRRFVDAIPHMRANAERLRAVLAR